MSEEKPAESVQLSDPRALRAYAHPIRLALVGLLRAQGPKTATQAAEAIGESVASCSFHLRQLAKYGLVEEAGGGRGREKPWRATAMSTTWESVATGDPEQDAATEALQLAIVQRYSAKVAGWVRTQAAEPVEWQEAAQFGDSLMYASAQELHELGERINELVLPYRTRLTDTSPRPPDSRLVSMLHLAFPVNDSVNESKADDRP